MPSTLLLARDFAGSHTAVVASRPLLNHIGPRLMQSPMKVTCCQWESVCSLDPALTCRFSPLFEFTETNIRSAMPILKHCSVARSFQSSLAIVTNDNVARDAALYKQFVELLSDQASSSFQHLDSLLLRVSLRRGIDPGIPLQELTLPANLPSLGRLCAVARGRIYIGPSTLKQIAINFRGLTHLELQIGYRYRFGGVPPFSGADLGEMLSALVNLRALRLQQVFSIGDSGQNCFLEHVTLRLHHLALRDVGHDCSLVQTTRNSNGIETTPLAQYLARARELTYFEFGAPGQVASDNCRKLFQPELISDRHSEAVFGIEHLILVSEVRNVDFLRFFPNLRSFKAALQHPLGSQAMQRLPEFAPNLTSLDLAGSSTFRCLDEAAIESLQHLRSLCLRGVNEPVTSLHLLTRLQNLTALDITIFGGWSANVGLKAELASFRLPPRLEVFDFVAGTNCDSECAYNVLFSCLKLHPKGLLRHVRLPSWVGKHEALFREWCGPNAVVEFV